MKTENVFRFVEDIALSITSCLCHSETTAGKNLKTFDCPLTKKG